MSTVKEFYKKYKIPAKSQSLPDDSLPKWLNSERRDILIKLWTEIGGSRCLLGHVNCPIKEHYAHIDSHVVKAQIGQPVKCVDSHGLPLKDTNGNQLYITVYQLNKVVEHEKKYDRLYDVKTEALIKYWIDDDRDKDRYEWNYESNQLHKTSDRHKPIRGLFSGISRDIWHDTQPLYYLESMGISGLTFKPFAKLRLASSGTRIYVDISDVLKPLSKNARRKAIRYGKSSLAIENGVKATCSKAVKTFLNYHAH